jgi:DNA-binding transcriptional LysR family regulator
VLDGWLAHNRLARGPVIPALSGQDLRALRHLVAAGFGWTVLPDYLCRTRIDRGELVEIPPPVAPMAYTYHLIWAPSALRQPRVAHARRMLLSSLRPPGNQA